MELISKISDVGDMKNDHSMIVPDYFKNQSKKNSSPRKTTLSDIQPLNCNMMKQEAGSDAQFTTQYITLKIHSIQSKHKR